MVFMPVSSALLEVEAKDGKFKPCLENAENNYLN